MNLVSLSLTLRDMAFGLGGCLQSPSALLVSVEVYPECPVRGLVPDSSLSVYLSPLMAISKSITEFHTTSCYSGGRQ